MKEVAKDTRPIYLGYCKSHKKYWFYAIKSGVPRFLSYVNYFYWDIGPQTVLSIEPIPEGLEQELEQFLIGTVTYEFFKRRKNSKSSEVRKIFRLPIEVSGPALECLQEQPSIGSGSGTGKPGNDIPTNTPPERESTGDEGLPKQRRTRRPRLAKPVELPSETIVKPSPELETALIALLKPTRKPRITKVVEVVEVVKPKRGRPFKVKT